MADKKISALPAATTPLTGTEVLPIVQGGTTDQVSVANLTAGRAVSTGALSVVGANAVLDNAYSLSGKLVAGTAVSLIKRNASDEVTIDEDGYGTKIGFGGRYNFAGGGNFTVGLGNVIIGTAGRGIDFSANANAPGMTSEVLTWYEQGTWTPVLSDGTNNASFGANSGWYTRVGNLVTVGFSAYNLDVSGLSSTATPLRITGLPFTSGSRGAFNAAALPLNLSGENLFLVINSASTSIFINRATGTVDSTPLTRAGAGTPNNMSVYGQIAYNV